MVSEPSAVMWKRSAYALAETSLPYLGPLADAPTPGPVTVSLPSESHPFVLVAACAAGSLAFAKSLSAYALNPVRVSSAPLPRASLLLSTTAALRASLTVWSVVVTALTRSSMCCCHLVTALRIDAWPSGSWW